MVYGKLVTLYSSVALEARAQEMMRTLEGSAMAKCILSFASLDSMEVAIEGDVSCS